MRKIYIYITTFFAFLLVEPSTGKEVTDNSIVYIYCKLADGSLSQGSGVIISQSGHVLTSKHVVADSSQCFGSRGTTEIGPKHRELDLRDRHDVFDAALLEFTPYNGESFEVVKYTEVTKEMRGAEVWAYGFPKEHKGAPVQRPGEISSTRAEGDGTIEISIRTARGMSGGPVFLGDGTIIGIVAKEFLDPTTGLTLSDRVLLAEHVARQFKELEIGLDLGSTVGPDKNSGSDGDESSGWEIFGEPGKHTLFNIISGRMGDDGVTVREGSILEAKQTVALRTNQRPAMPRPYDTNNPIKREFDINDCFEVLESRANIRFRTWVKLKPVECPF